MCVKGQSRNDKTVNDGYQNGNQKKRKKTIKKKKRKTTKNEQVVAKNGNKENGN